MLFLCMRLLFYFNGNGFYFNEISYSSVWIMMLIFVLQVLI